MTRRKCAHQWPLSTAVTGDWVRRCWRCGEVYVRDVRRAANENPERPAR